MGDGVGGVCEETITIEELSGLQPLQIFLCTHINHGERKKEKLQPKKSDYYITCTSLLFPFFEVGLERTKDLELLDDIMLGKYCTWSSILPPKSGSNSAVKECFLVCRQGMNKEICICSLKIVQNIPVFVKKS